MKSGDTYRFSLSWPMDTEERILAGEFLNKLGNKKSRFLIQLICGYIGEHPEAMNPKETIKIIVNSTSAGDTLVDMIRTIIKTEFAGKFTAQEQSVEQPAIANLNKNEPEPEINIGDMLGNLDIWNGLQ